MGIEILINLWKNGKKYPKSISMATKFYGSIKNRQPTLFYPILSKLVIVAIYLCFFFKFWHLKVWKTMSGPPFPYYLVKNK